MMKKNNVLRDAAGIKLAVCLIAFFVLFICGIRAEEVPLTSKEQKNDQQVDIKQDQEKITGETREDSLELASAEPFISFYSSDDGYLVKVWEAASNYKNNANPEKLRYWIDYSYIIRIPGTVVRIKRDNVSDTETFKFKVENTLYDVTRMEALTEIRKILSKDIGEKIKLEQIIPLVLEDISLESPITKLAIEIKDDYAESKWRGITLPKKNVSSFFKELSAVKKGWNNSEIIAKLKFANLVGGEKLTAVKTIFLKDDHGLPVRGTVFFKNIEKNIREEKQIVKVFHVCSEDTKKGEQIEELIQVDAPEGLLLDRYKVNIDVTTTGDIEDYNVSTPVFNNEKDKELTGFTVKVSVTSLPAKILESVEPSLLEEWLYKIGGKKNKKKREQKVTKSQLSSGEMQVSISYQVYNERDPVDAKLKLDEKTLWAAYDPEKYTMQYMTVVYEDGYSQKFNAVGRYGMIFIKEDDGKVLLQF